MSRVLCVVLARALPGGRAPWEVECELTRLRVRFVSWYGWLLHRPWCEVCATAAVPWRCCTAWQVWRAKAERTIADNTRPFMVERRPR